MSPRTMSVLCVCFLFGVGGSDRWFGTSVEDTAELPRSQGSLPVKPGGAKLGRGAVSLSDARAQLKFLPRKCSLAHISAHRTVSHHRSKLTQIPRTEGVLLFPVHFYASAALQVKKPTHVSPF